MKGKVGGERIRKEEEGRGRETDENWQEKRKAAPQEGSSCGLCWLRLCSGAGRIWGSPVTGTQNWPTSGSSNAQTAVESVCVCVCAGGGPLVYCQFTITSPVRAELLDHEVRFCFLFFLLLSISFLVLLNCTETGLCSHWIRAYTCVAVGCREACQVFKPTMQTSHSQWQAKWDTFRKYSFNLCQNSVLENLQNIYKHCTKVRDNAQRGVHYVKWMDFRGVTLGVWLLPQSLFICGNGHKEADYLVTW